MTTTSGSTGPGPGPVPGPVRRVGLTGGVASGKSTVSAMLTELGAVVIDADLLAREVVAPGTEGLAEVVAAFGPEVLTPAGDLDRPALGAIVFADEARRRVLEGIIHPRVRARGAEIEAAAGPDALVVHDIPLLAESDGAAGAFDAVIVVDAPPELQVARMVGDRGWTRADAESRIAAQATREQRRAIATYVVENTGTREDLRRRVAEVYAEVVSAGSRND
jgi:dephospho-CoA kinase